MIKHSIRVMSSGYDATELGLACIALYAEGRVLRISISKSINAARHICSLKRDDSSPPDWVKKSISSKICSQVIKMILNADALASRRFQSGGQVNLSINKEASAMASHRKLQLTDISSIRSGHLVRPLIIENPNLDNLYSYQVEGVNWLLSHNRGILADDMGLGKTVQVVSALRQLFSSGSAEKALLICPKSLTKIWQDHLSDWAPELIHAHIDPPAKDRELFWTEALQKTHVMITTYEALLGLNDILSESNIDVVVADEAHRIRNASSRVSQSIRTVRPNKFWALTGTPVERDQNDLLTLMTIIQPNQFSILDRHRSLEWLREKASPFVLRRLKDDVLNDLPKIRELNKSIELLPQQRSNYNKKLMQFMQANPNDRLSLLTQLREMCDVDPESGESSKSKEILNIIRNIQSKSEKVIVFSYLLKPLDLLETKLVEEFGINAVLKITGSLNAIERSEAIHKFKNEPYNNILLASSRVGGEGLTLTEANHAIFVNRWWNPSSNTQARDRIYRIGQKKPVTIYSFTCKDTVEEHLDKIIAAKTWTTKELVDRLAVLLRSSTS